MKKYTLGIVVLLAVCISPVVVQAQTKGLTDSQIQSILSLLSSFGADQSVIHNVQVSLTGGTPIIEKKPFCHIFNKDLTVGNRGDDVVALNQALAASGIDTTSNSSDFSENNAGDVVSFQAKYGIRQTGYVGPMTRAKLNALYKCRDEQEPTPVPVPQPTEPTTPCAPCDTTCSGNSNTPVSVGCLPPSTTIYEQVSEQVKCVFNGATTEQKCWGDVPASTVNTPVERYSCAGVGTCVVTVRGQSGKPMVWGSSCGGSSSTSIDGNSEYANFSCATSSSGVTVVTPNGGENWKIGETYTIHYSLRGINVDASNPILIYLQKGYDYPNVKSGVNSSLLIGTTKDTESFSYTVPADIAS